MIYTVGNAVDIPDESLICKHISESTIIFLGKMSYDPNIIAVSYFTKNIFPALKKDFSDLKFLIIGANPVKQITKLSEIDGVQVLGYVDSLSDYFQNSTVVVAPMLTGAGIQNKIIQAMSFGCCVATTSIGAEGLNITDEISIFDTTFQWINGMKELLTDKTKRKDLGTKARTYILNNLSKNRISTDFWEFIESTHIHH